MEILIDTTANMEYGLLIAIVLDALLLFAIASSNSRKQLSVMSFIIAVVLLVPLSFQMSRLIGAHSISGTASTISVMVDTVSPTLGKYVESYSSHEIGWFIFRRVMWSVFFMAIAGFCIYVTMDVKRGRSQTGRRYNSTVSSRRR